MIEIGGEFAVDRDHLFRAGMGEFEVGGVQGDTIDAGFGGLGGMEFPVSDDGMAEGGKLSANLIL